MLQSRQLKGGAHDAEHREGAEAAAQQMQRVSAPRVAHLGHGRSVDTIMSTVRSPGLYLARFWRNFARSESSLE
jgi:hypothetical protein